LLFLVIGELLKMFRMCKENIWSGFLHLRNYHKNIKLSYHHHLLWLAICSFCVIILYTSETENYDIVFEFDRLFEWMIDWFCLRQNATARLGPRKYHNSNRKAAKTAPMSITRKQNMCKQIAKGIGECRIESAGEIGTWWLSGYRHFLWPKRSWVRHSFPAF